jgi:hypothetical protein
MTSVIHDAFIGFFAQSLSINIKSWLASVLPDHSLSLLFSPLFKLEGVPIPRKAPDAGLFFARKGTITRWPQFVVEVGYSQTAKQLRRDARTRLLGSSNQVQSVLIVKFEKPNVDASNPENWTCWMEIWVRSSSAR